MSELSVSRKKSSLARCSWRDFASECLAAKRMAKSQIPIIIFVRDFAVNLDPMLSLFGGIRLLRHSRKLPRGLRNSVRRSSKQYCRQLRMPTWLSAAELNVAQKKAVRSLPFRALFTALCFARFGSVFKSAA